MKIIEEGHNLMLELADDWTVSEKNALKDMMKLLFADKKLVKEQSTSYLAESTAR